MYIQHPNKGCTNFHSKFQKRFQIQFSEYRILVDGICICARFKQWVSRSAFGDDTSPIELLVLGALRYLGCGWTFNDLEESTGISEEVHHVFFHKFIKYGSIKLFAKHVVMPQSNKDALCHEYDAAGLAECVRSMDATHIMCEQVFHHMRQCDIGYKISQTSHTYNLIAVNHACRILSTTWGYPGSWNSAF